MTTGPAHPSPGGPAQGGPEPANPEPLVSRQDFMSPPSPPTGVGAMHSTPQPRYGGPASHHPAGPPYPPQPAFGTPFSRPGAPHKHSTRSLLAVGAVAAVLGLGGGLLGGVIASEGNQDTGHQVQTSQGETVSDTSDNAAISARNSVVAISTGEGSGSGVVLTEDGYILTNNHVVSGARSLQVTLPDGNKVDAEVLATAADNDLALVKADANGLTPATFAENAVEVGDSVYAIGSPFGLDGTVTKGIVSATDRDLEISRGETLQKSIQTDAAINPGNSGGALVNTSGQVVGINTAIASGGSNANAGIGFAIPASAAKDFANAAMDEV
ncbi:MAG: trypsin-like serine protease [Corynebacteriales bacterium]|nr:trypsin-like serine protease [Mycobacteriales bacterium]